MHIEDRDRAFNQYRSSYRSDREMDISAMLDAIDNSRAEARGTMAVMDSSVREFVAAAVGPNGDGSAPEDGEPADLRQRADDLKDRLKKHWRLNKSRQRKADAFLVEIHKKFSIPTACLAFALIGLALGVTNRKDGKLASFALGIGVIFAYFFRKTIGERVILVASTIPIAIAVNSFRVALTGALAHYFGKEAATGVIHELEGLFTFVLALMLLFIILNEISGAWC